MKRLATMTLLAAAAAATGCAAVSRDVRYEVDAEYVAAVENAAKRQGTQVYWINYPQKTVAPTR